MLILFWAYCSAWYALYLKLLFILEESPSNGAFDLLKVYQCSGTSPYYSYYPLISILRYSAGKIAFDTLGLDNLDEEDLKKGALMRLPYVCCRFY